MSGDVYAFGVGGIWFVPPTSNATPVPIGGAQDLTLEVTEEVKEYYGQFKYPVAVARGKGKATGKGKFGRISLDLVNSVLTGSTIANGTSTAVLNEAGTVPTTPYQITVVHSATWATDLGVWDFVAGKPLTKVASSPATGQYSIAAGVYTFAAADTGKSVGISYDYTTAGSGRTVTYTNQLMGAATLYAFYGSVQTPDGRNISWKLPSVIMTKVPFALKNDDFTNQDFEFTAQADSSGNVLYMRSDV